MTQVKLCQKLNNHKRELMVDMKGAARPNLTLLNPRYDKNIKKSQPEIPGHVRRLEFHLNVLFDQCGGSS